MIWLIVTDTETPVDLLQQNHPHQLVRERHFGKAQQVVGSFEDRGVESQ